PSARRARRHSPRKHLLRRARGAGRTGDPAGLRLPRRWGPPRPLSQPGRWAVAPAAGVRLGRAQRRHALLRAERLPPLPPVPRRGQWRAAGLAPALLRASRAAHPASLRGGGRGGGDPPLALARGSPAPAAVPP